MIFGGAGDLSRRKLIPALYNLSLDGELPDKFAILGFSMEDLDDEKYRAFALSGIEQFSRRPVDKEHWAKFAPMLHFNRGSFTEAADYQNLRNRCEAIDSEARHRGQSRILFRDSAGLHRHLLGRIDRRGHDSSARQRASVYPGRGRKADRIRSRERVRNQRRTRAPFRREPDFQNRSLPRQGDGREPDGVAIRQRDLRTYLDGALRRSRADNRRRGRGRRHARRLLRSRRRAARHGAEPSAANALHDRDRAAQHHRRRVDARCEARRAARATAARRRGPREKSRARPVR